MKQFREGNVLRSKNLSADPEINRQLHSMVDFLDDACHEGFMLEEINTNYTGRDFPAWSGGLCSFECIALSQTEVILQTMEFVCAEMRKGRNGLC